MHLYKLISLLTFLPFCFSTTVNQCDGVKLPRFVQINDCVIGPCVLKIGGAVTANVTFDVSEDISVLTPEVKVSLFGSNFAPFPLPDKKGCDNLISNRCPIDAGERITYQLYMPLDKNIPAITLDLRLALLNDSIKPKTEITCFIITLAVEK